MRSAHSSDLKHFAFADGFGLTRVSLPNKAKTERKISAGLDATISMNPTRTELLAWRQNWDSMHHLGFPSLKSLTKIDRFKLSQTLLAPDGGFVELKSYAGATPTSAARRWSDPHTSGPEVTLDLPVSKRGEGVSLDGAAPGFRWTRALSSPAGVWALRRGSDGMLLVGDLTEPPARLRWYAPVGAPRDALVTLHPFDDGRVVLCAFSPRRLESTVVRYSADGRVEARRVLPSLNPAAVASPELALHQLDPGTVVRTPLDGGSSVTTALSDHGVGRVLGEGNSLHFVPWHAESVVNLNTGDAVSRKLGPGDEHVRRFFREQVARANAMAMPAGMVIELRSFDANPARSEFGFSWDHTPGDGSLVGVLAAGSLAALTDDDRLRDLGGWRWAVGGGLSPELDKDRWDEREVDEAFGALETAGVPLWEALQCMQDSYSFWHGSPAPQRLSFILEGARRFLAGMTWSLTHDGVEGLRVGARELAPSLSAAHVVDALKHLPAQRGPRVGYHALDLLCCVSAHALRHDAVKVIAAMCKAPDAWRSGLGSLLEPAVRWLASDAPDPTHFATMLLIDTQSREDVCFYVRRALG